MSLKSLKSKNLNAKALYIALKQLIILSLYGLGDGDASTKPLEK